MEAAKPIFFTPMPEEKKPQIELKDMKLIEIKNFEIELTNKKFTLELAKSEDNKNIILKLYCNKEKKLKYYIKIINLETFYFVNYSFFHFYKDIDEIYNSLFETIDKNKYSIDIKENKAILTFEFPLPGDKVVDINFELNEEKIKNEELMELLKEMIDNLNDDDNIIKEDINNLKKENDNLKMELKKKDEEFKIIKNNLDNANDQIKKLKEENIEIKERLKIIEKNMNKKKAKRIDENAPKKEENEMNLINKHEEIKEAFAYENRVKKDIEKYDKNEGDINGKENIEKNNLEKEVNKNHEAKQPIFQTEIENKAKKNERLQISSSKKPINIENLFNESKIINSIEEKQMLVNWISSKGNIKEINLLYRATDNGDDSETFFDRCSGMGPTLSLIKTKKEKIFGGFSKAAWIKKNKMIKDEDAFLFSINNKEKYDILKPENAINCIPDKCTLIYGNNNDRYGIRLFSNFFEKNSFENMATKTYNTPSNYCLTGNNIFLVKEAEVYQIIFNEN